jgi:hypothetical protein
MPHMLAMPTVQPRHPMLVFVLIKADYLPLHRAPPPIIQ